MDAKTDFGAEACLNKVALVNEGWTDPKRGHYAVVFTRGDEALKIYKAEDVAYHAWVTRTPNHGGPFPRRLSTPQRVTFSIRHRAYDAYMVVLERLQTSSPLNIEKTLFHVHSALHYAREQKQQRPSLDEFADRLGENFIAAIHTAIDIRDEYPNRNNLFLDLRDSNVMVRPSTGELVLTDPLACDC